MVALLDAFKCLNPVSIAVIGDFVIDKYIFGSVARISPEAPVPVVLAQQIKNVPGMAGNVALNLEALGAKVYLFGRIGKDREGKAFLTYLKEANIEVEGIIQDIDYITPVKERVISQSQQLLRIDYEQTHPLSEKSEQRILQELKKVISQLDLIALSDYKKGLLTKSLITKIIDLAQEHSIKVIVDPKGSDFSKYKGAFLIKPNLSEAYIAANLEKSTPLDLVAQKILKETYANYLLITKSEEGMSLFSTGRERKDFSVISREVKDVTGAGDTVLSMLALCLANKIPLDETCALCNIAASLVIEKIGCGKVSLSEIARSILQTHLSFKVFEEKHLYALHQILLSQNFSVLILSTQVSITKDLFKNIKLIKSRVSASLLVYIEQGEDPSEMISFLSSLEDVDFILKSASELSILLGNLKPEKAYTINEDKLLEVQDPLVLLTQLLYEKIS